MTVSATHARQIAPALFMLLLGGCGGGSSSSGDTITVADTTAATANVSPAGILGIRDSLVITFSEAMTPTSLSFDGGLGAISDGGIWSSGNTILTLAPDELGAWESGNQSLKLTVEDTAGNITTVDMTLGIDFTVSDFQNAAVVIGQTDFTGASANQGGTAGAETLDTPYGVPSFHDNILWVPDYANNRVLGFDGIPTANGAAASYVVGQTDFATTTPGMSEMTVTGPQQLLFHNNHYYLLEYDNSRLLVFDSAPYLAPRTATAVVGQADFTSKDTSCTALNFDQPETMLIVDGKLLVTDTSHNRVLIWNNVPTATGTPPNLVLGQSDFTHCANDDDNQDGFVDGIGTTERTFEFPNAVWSDGARLVVMDSFNNRALIWNSFPTTNFQPTDIVLGQANFTDDRPNVSTLPAGEIPPPTASTLRFAWEGIWSNSRQLFISDSSNNRVLVWSRFPTENFQPTDAALGQSDFVHAAANDDNQDGSTETASARTLSSPGGLLIVRDKLIVHESANNRVLVFKSH